MKQKQASKCSSVSLILCLVFTLFLCGVLVSMHSVPTHDPAGENLQALYKYSSEHVKQWATTLNKASIPFNVDFSAPSWTPIAISGIASSDPTIELCKLDFQEYSKNPHLYAMFKDLVAKSRCTGTNRKSARLSALKAEIKAKPKESTYLEPTGFVFHESRVGSTLVANMLASDPLSMVFSESAPPSAVMMATSISRERKIELFRDVITLMGLTTMHKRMFFKFQSITNTANTIALEAFPNTPWVFVYRQAVQTIMSHVGGGKTGAPCLRSKGSRAPPEVADTIEKWKATGNSPTNAAWCAAHLNMLCQKALSALEAYGEYRGTGTDKDGTQRGIVVDYAGLPGAIPRLMLPLFGVEDISPPWVSKMEESSQFYSKGGRKKVNEVFRGDSEEKDAAADQAIKDAAAKILQPTYEILEEMAISTIFNMKQKIIGEELSQGARLDSNVLWRELSPLPQVKGGAVTLAANAPNVPDSGYAALESLSPEIDLLWRSFASNHSSKSFERVSCPDFPEKDYPKEYPIMDLLNNWNPDKTDIPPMHYDSICHFDYQTQYDIAERYRNAEKPFVVYNVPAVNNLVKKWSDVDYINRRLGRERYHSETSKSNHFMYFKGTKAKNVKSYNGTKVFWEPPTKAVKITFQDWLKVAVAGQATDSIEERTHIYFRVTAQNQRGPNGWLFEETEIFKPQKSLFMVNPKEQRGVHCRFGMRSIIAENHYDGSRNFVVEVGGLRRWILSHPKNCENMYLLQKGHPSGRHSEVDWSAPDHGLYPKFKNIMANEIIFKPGDVLYVPTSWFHYIVSLNVNWQCNSRSGRDISYSPYLKKCGWS